MKSLETYLSTILNKSNQIFWVFDKSGLLVKNKSTQNNLLKEVDSDKIIDLLKIPKIEIQAFWDWFNLVFQNEISFDTLLDLAPSQVQFDNKFYQVQFSQLIYEDNKVEDILVILTDKSDEIQKNEKVNTLNHHVQFLIAASKNKEVFKKFVSGCRKLFLESLIIFEDIENINIKNILQLQMNLHTIKGAIACFDLIELKNDIHFFEDKIKKFHDKFVQSDFKNKYELKSLWLKIKLEMSQINDEFEKVLKDNKQLIGDFDQELETYREIPLDLILNWYDKIKNLIPNNSIIYQNFLNDFAAIEASKVFSIYNDILQHTAKELGKSVDLIQFVNNENVKIFPEHYQEVLNSFVHIFRNIVDHGIEYEQDRIQKQKNPLAKVKIEFQNIEIQNKSFIRIIIQDDGQGVQFDKIRDKLISENTLSIQDALSLNQSELIDYILKGNLSTAKEITDISGRGVGLVTVFEEVKKINGHFSMKSETDLGTVFIIELPVYKLFRLEKNILIQIPNKVA